jgi:hypothetical protein
MSRTFQFTVDDQIAVEIEQYIYGKMGLSPPKGLSILVLAQISKNPLTEAQIARIEKKYTDEGKIAPACPSATAQGDLKGG